jgi:hypothetical protein
MKKPAKRFGYLEHTIEPVTEKEAMSQGADMPPIEDGGSKCSAWERPHGSGSYPVERARPTVLKRRAAAKAVLEGRTLGDVLETFCRTMCQITVSTDVMLCTHQ